MVAQGKAYLSCSFTIHMMISILYALELPAELIIDDQLEAVSDISFLS
jgi:hypothetical protein